MRKKPELLAPAGTMEKLQMALAYGADAQDGHGPPLPAGCFLPANRMPALNADI